MIYLDHSATTPLSPTVLEAMTPYFTADFGNASTLYPLGRRAKEALEEARETIAKAIGAASEEIFFTSGGTESDNWVITKAVTPQKNHIVVSAIEHPAILESCKFMATQGNEITYLKADNDGGISPSAVAEAIGEKTVVVSVMSVNNEVGTIEPIDEIAAVCKERGVPFHTDAVQALGTQHFDVHKENITYLSLSAHKFYGPKGIGILYMEKNHFLPPLLYGGGQENNRRSGTENLPLIMGMAKAIEETEAHRREALHHFAELREAFLQNLQGLPFALNSHTPRAVPNIISITIPQTEAEALLYLLSIKGICVSAGSACHGGNGKPSHVLLAMGRCVEEAKSTLRISLGKDNTIEEMQQAAKEIKKCFGLMK